MAKGKLELKITPSKEVAYLSLPDHPGSGTPGVSCKQVNLHEIYPNYSGATLYFDFDKDNRLIGIEILV
jgi:hypothetical protein